MLAGLNDVLLVAGYSIVLQGASPAHLASLPLLRRIESDGICLLTSGTAEQRYQTIEQLAALGQPLVLIQDELPDGIADACPALVQSLKQACRDAAAFCLMGRHGAS
jgi:LacI family transcriptional regulator